MWMNKRVIALAGLLSLLAATGGLLSAASESDATGSGTYRGRILSDLFMRRQRLARNPQMAKLSAESRPAPRQDVGEIAIIDTSNGVVPDPNPFDLGATSLLISPSGSGYTVAPGNQGINLDALGGGLPLTLADDDVREIRLPFAFPYFGKTHDVAFVHSDGNLSFEKPDASSTGRNFSRAFVGPPRILPLFTDLDPTKSGATVSVYALSDRVVISWEAVPTFQRFGIGPRQTFQTALFSDGRVEFIYGSITVPNAVVGILPGRSEGEPTPVDMSIGLTGPATGAVAEIFTNLRALDCFAATQQFYRNHDDVYDFVVFFNDIGLSNGPGQFAFEVNVRNNVQGIGDLLFNDPMFDFGVDFGSPRRLASFLSMGPLSNYPTDPTQRIPAIGENSTLSVLGQEVGHRFLAYPEFIDPATGLRSQQLLGRQLAHWNFFLNSQASVVEGNLIEDRGPSVSPRFFTTETVSRFSELDQYLMGLRAPEEVATMFLVENPRNGVGFSSPSRSPQTGISFDGDRKDVPLDQLIAAEGPRLPDHTVAQRDFRFAFILIVADDSNPSEAALAKLDRFRADWLDFFHQAVDDRSVGRTGLVKQLELSTWPAGGVVVGHPGTARVSIKEPLAVDLIVNLTSSDGVLTIPATVTIPAAELAVEFVISGVSSGLTTLSAEATQPGFDRSVSRVQVRDDLTALTLEVVSGESQVVASGAQLPEPIVFRLVDRNFSPYSGIALDLERSGGSFSNMAATTTDALGQLSVNWVLPGTPGVQTLTARLADEQTVFTTVNVRVVESGPAFSAISVTNAASFATGEQSGTGFAPGSLITIFGTGLATGTGFATSFPLPDELQSTRVTINGVPVPLLFVNETQINLQLPFELSGDSFTITAATPVGASDRVQLALSSSQPGIFFDSLTGIGAIVNQDGTLAFNTAAPAGSVIQVFATGLGAVSPAGRTGLPALASPLARVSGTTRVLIDGVEVSFTFAGLAPFTAGLYQVNVELAGGLPAGRHTLTIEVDGRVSNSVQFDSN